MMRAITVLSAAVLALAGCGGADAAAPVAAPPAKASPPALPAAPASGPYGSGTFAPKKPFCCARSGRAVVA